MFEELEGVIQLKGYHGSEEEGENLPLEKTNYKGGNMVKKGEGL